MFLLKIKKKKTFLFGTKYVYTSRNLTFLPFSSNTSRYFYVHMPPPTHPKKSTFSRVSNKGDLDI